MSNLRQRPHTLGTRDEVRAIAAPVWIDEAPALRREVRLPRVMSLPMRRSTPSWPGRSGAYRWNAGKLELRIADPWGVPPYWMSWDELQPQWANIKGLHTEFGYNRFGIVLGASPADKGLGPQRLDGVRITEREIDHLADLVNDGVRISHGRLRSVFSAIHDSSAAVFGLLVFPLRKLVDRGIDRTDGKDVAPPVEVTGGRQTRPIARQIRWALPSDREVLARASVRAIENSGLARGLKSP